MNEYKENLKFVLFHPVSICVMGKQFKYCIKDSVSYPCLLGFITDESFGTNELKCFEVITGRKFDIINSDDFEIPHFAGSINTSLVMQSPACICRWVNDSLENLQLIEKYIDAKGDLSQNEIAKSSDFSYRLNRLLSNRPMMTHLKYSTKGFYDTLKNYEASKDYLQKIDIENLKTIKEIEYIINPKNENCTLTEKDDIIFRLKNKLSFIKEHRK